MGRGERRRSRTAGVWLNLRSLFRSKLCLIPFRKAVFGLVVSLRTSRSSARRGHDGAHGQRRRSHRCASRRPRGRNVKERIGLIQRLAPTPPSMARSTSDDAPTRVLDVERWGLVLQRKLVSLATDHADITDDGTPQKQLPWLTAGGNDRMRACHSRIPAAIRAIGGSNIAIWFQPRGYLYIRILSCRAANFKGGWRRK
jgi:hypothetical protein